jgi:DNA-binding transcriptional ArsR family regulator
MCARDDGAGAEYWQVVPSGERVEAAASAFRLLGDPTRLRILWVLCGGETDVTTVTRQVGAARPAVSQHLAKLRLAGLVVMRREGRRVLYRAGGAHVRRLVAEAFESAGHRITGRPDHP